MSREGGSIISFIPTILSLLSLLCLVWLLVLHLHRPIPSYSAKGPKAGVSGVSGESGSCSKSSCGAIDPVNDPDYNVREIIKNTILIEQHLSDKNKYCKQCLVKHFLLSIGLLEEAVWMAGPKLGTFPMLEESVAFYSGVFNAWLLNHDSDPVRLDTLNHLRKWRRDASEIYFPTGA